MTYEGHSTAALAIGVEGVQSVGCELCASQTASGADGRKSGMSPKSNQ